MAPSVGTALTPLIGRERELQALDVRLAGGARLITLLGPGGSGKTRLAREVFEQRLSDGADAHFVDLVGVLDPGLVPAEIATELGVSETPELDVAAVVTASLRDASAVLVLDNLEELTGARDFLAGLLRDAPGLQVVATSRIPLDIGGEVEFQVPPLELPRGEGSRDVESSPAGRLFLERARAVGRLDEFDAATAQAIAELCRRLDGLPLALELAAARTRILPPASILRHLADRTAGVLNKTGRGESRHQSLDAVLRWSLDLLEPNEAEVLKAVAICPGGFDLAIAQALAPDRDVLGAIDVLASHGLLLRRGEVEGEPWYQLLETIRSAALERSAEATTEAAWKQLATHLSERVAGTYEAYHRLDVGEFRRLDALVDNVRAALDWTEVNDARLNLVIAARFGWYWLDDKSREGLARLRTAIPASPDASPDLAMALIIQARIVDRIDGPDAASHVAMEAARMARVLGDPDLELLAVALALPANRAAAPEQASRIRKLLGSVEDPVSRFIGLTALAGAVQDDSGVTDEVIEILQGAAAAVSGTSYRRPQGMAAAYMAEAFIHGQQPSEAYRYSSNALSALREGGPHTRSWILTIHAIAASGAGHNGEAAMSLRSAIEVAPDRHASSFVGVMLAAVVVLTAWGSPHRAAMTCGLIDAVTSFDPLPETEAAYWDRLLAAARRAADPVAFEIAFREGQKAGVDQVINEVLAHLDAVEASPAPAAAVRLQHGTLTTREVEVLTLVGAGRSDAEIAAALYISPKTASVHVSNAKAKLGVETRLEAALWARDRGLVDGEPDA